MEEIKDLAKTKTLKEIASHFNISTSNFRVMRKEQPEIDAIYNAVPKDRLRTKYTPTELLEIEKMLATLSMETIQNQGQNYIRYFYVESSKSIFQLYNVCLDILAILAI